LRWRKAADLGQSGRGVGAPDIRDRWWRSGLDRRPRLGRAATVLGLILRLACLLSELGLRILRDEFAFIGRRSLGRCGRGIGRRIDFGKLVVAFAGARNGRWHFGRRGLACLCLDSGCLRGWPLRRLDRFGLVRSGDQVGDGSVAGACLQAQQQPRMEQRRTRRGKLGGGHRRSPIGFRQRAILALAFGPMRRGFLLGLVLDDRRWHDAPRTLSGPRSSPV
jgi:hypothetical protein